MAGSPHRGRSGCCRPREAAGYAGSDRNFRRLVAQAKEAWRREHRRPRRPAVLSPAEYLVIDWGAEFGLHVFCVVLAWSRFRFVHSDRSRDRLPRHLQRPHPDAQRRLPSDQDLRRARSGRVLHPRADPGLPRHPGMDHREREPGPSRPGMHRQEPRPGSRGHRRRAGRAQGPLLRRRRPGRRLYRALADNTVGKVIDTLLRHDLILIDVGFSPLGDTGSQLLFRLVSAAYERRSLGIAGHWPFENWGKFLPEHTTAVSLLDRLLHHASVVITSGDIYRMKQAEPKENAPEQHPTQRRGGD